MRSYESDKIRVNFDGKRCIHARRCVLNLPSVFQIEGGVTAGLAVAGAAAAAAFARAPLAITVVIGIAVAWAMAGGIVGG